MGCLPHKPNKFVKMSALKAMIATRKRILLLDLIVYSLADFPFAEHLEIVRQSCPILVELEVLSHASQRSCMKLKESNL